MLLNNLTDRLAHLCAQGYVAVLSSCDRPLVVDAKEAREMFERGVAVFRLQAVEMVSDITGNIEDDD